MKRFDLEYRTLAFTARQQKSSCRTLSYKKPIQQLILKHQKTCKQCNKPGMPSHINFTNKTGWRKTTTTKHDVLFDKHHGPLLLAKHD